MNPSASSNTQSDSYELIPAHWDNVPDVELTPTEVPSLDKLIVGGTASDELFPAHWENEPDVELSSTGVPFLDKLMVGGTAPGEVYGIMGPYGTCKTTLAFQLHAEAARAFAAEAEQDGEKKVAVLVNYETTREEAMQRSISYAARIPSKRMEERRHKPLTTTENRSRYELEMNHRAHHYGRPAFSSGEHERREEVMSWFSKHAVIIDMTRGQAGAGGITEVVDRVEEMLVKRGCRCGFIAIDYLGAMAKFKLMAEEGTFSDPVKLARLISQFAMRARLDLAIRFDCPVWLIHQLSGDANQRSPAAELNHSDAADCPLFAEHLDYSFIVGKLIEEDQVQIAKLKCTKHLRRPSRTSTIIKVNGAWSRVDEARDLSVDPGTGKVLPKQDVDVF